MKKPPLSKLEALDSCGAGFRVEFFWRSDRYAHTIYGVLRGEAIPLLESDEGDSTAVWPVSPPLQQLHREERPGIGVGAVLLLTGVAGKSHWSASVTGFGDARYTNLGFRFACRFREQPEWLGATYRVAKGIFADQPSEDGGILLKTGEQGIEFALCPSTIEISIATEWILTSSVRMAGDTVKICTQNTPHMTTPTTKEWAYELRFTRPHWIE